MCKYSLEGYANRPAEQGETLVVNAHYSGHGGSMTPKGNDRMLACVAHNTTLTIDNLQIPRGSCVTAYQPDETVRENRRYREVMQPVSLRNKIGKRHVVTLLDGTVTHSNYDMIRFEDGTVMFLLHLAKEMEMFVGTKPSELETKLELDAKTLRGVAADMIDPNDKKEGEDKGEEPQGEQPEGDEPVKPTAKRRVRTIAAKRALARVKALVS